MGRGKMATEKISEIFGKIQVFDSTVSNAGKTSKHQENVASRMDTISKLNELLSNLNNVQADQSESRKDLAQKKAAMQKEISVLENKVKMAEKKYQEKRKEAEAKLNQGSGETKEDREYIELCFRHLGLSVEIVEDENNDPQRNEKSIRVKFEADDKGESAEVILKKDGENGSNNLKIVSTKPETEDKERIFAELEEKLRESRNWSGFFVVLKKLFKQ